MIIYKYYNTTDLIAKFTLGGAFLFGAKLINKNLIDDLPTH